MFGWLGSIAQGIGAIIDTVTTSISDMGTTVLDGIREMLEDIFVPQEDYLSDKVASIKSRFGIIDSVSGTMDVIKDFIDTVVLGKPPKIEIHFENAESGICYGETAYALDMTWYDRYKPTVDVLLSSMIWVFFAWRVFTRLPDIINGVASSADDMSKIDKGR